MDLILRVWTRIPIAIKAGLAVFGVLFVVSLVQGAAIRSALGPVLGPASPPVVAFFAVPSLIGSLVAGALMGFMARRRVRRFVEGLQKIASGDFAARLPHAPDREFESVQHAFADMAESLAEARRRLEHADQQRRRLFADLAHELATPASAVLGLADTLARPELVPTVEARDRLVESLEREATRLSRLVTDVRDLANLDDPDVRFDVSDTDVARLVERLATEYGARVVVPQAPVSLRVDPVRFEQVMVNLLRNARRYTPDDGTILVALEPGDSRVELRVEDSGPGVPDELLERLGERLLRVDPSRDRRTGGHGLGLSIVRAIVARHDGTLTFGRSSLGGLAVKVGLPAR